MNARALVLVFAAIVLVFLLANRMRVPGYDQVHLFVSSHGPWGP